MQEFKLTNTEITKYFSIRSVESQTIFKCAETEVKIFYLEIFKGLTLSLLININCFYTKFIFDIVDILPFADHFVSVPFFSELLRIEMQNSLTIDRIRGMRNEFINFNNLTKRTARVSLPFIHRV